MQRDVALTKTLRDKGISNPQKSFVSKILNKNHFKFI